MNHRNVPTVRLSRAAAFVALALSSSSAFAAEHASVATVTVASGPHAGTYHFESPDTCMLATTDKRKPASFAAVLTAPKSMLSVDLPNVDPKRSAELQVELTIADPKSTSSRRNTASTEYLIDTRPDSSLLPYQVAERGKGGTTGRGSAKLTDHGTRAKLVISGRTAQGVRIDVTLDCRNVDREYGR